jgi:hypothetical protein
MKLFAGWILSAGLVFTAAAANAQGQTPGQISGSPYTAVSDVGGPYAEMPPEPPPPRYYRPSYTPGYEPGYGPALLAPTEVYAILRENGFSPLGIPQQRGLVYRIAAIDRRGDDGRLVIDARTGQIIRFVPMYRMGDNLFDEPRVVYGPAGPLPPMINMRGVPRPPAPVPRVASRTPPVPIPKAAPPHAAEIKPEAQPLEAKSAPEKSADKPATDKSAGEPAQQSAAVQAKPADVPATPPAAVPIVAAKPAPQIQPTQAMPKAQGLD